MGKIVTATLGTPTPTPGPTPSPVTTTAQPASETPEEKAAREERERQQREQSGNTGNDPLSGLIQMIIGFLVQMITGQSPDGSGAGDPGEDDGKTATPAPSVIAKGLYDSNAVAAWNKLKAANGNQPVNFSSPVEGTARVTSNFATRINPITKKTEVHRALDIAGSGNPDVLAPADGVILYNGPMRGFGAHAVVMGFGDGSTVIFGHMKASDAKPGTIVNRGNKIGVEGSEGMSTGNHLHFQWMVPDAKGNFVATRPKINGVAASTGMAFNGVESDGPTGTPSVPRATGSRIRTA